jgi:dienelactone hydrolase
MILASAANCKMVIMPRRGGRMFIKTAVALLVLISTFAFAADPPRAPAPPPGPGDAMLKEYFAAETAALQKACLADITSAADWDAKKGEYRRQLSEMLGLWPAPEKTDLKPIITGKIDHPEFTVENLHFQSQSGLYVTGNLYIPKNLDKPAPTILYVCGHSPVKKNGVSYGNKTAYQHWGAWFARNGYVCLVIDTLQLGEIEGIHHGTYREKMWWWHDRGYTPAGVEAWNDIRALDYLETRPEVDKTKFGVTGRSGGGAYSWYLAALDDRIKVAIPTAGITDLQNHVVDGTIEGHCDCMFMFNTYRWDFPMVAALVAPRPLLIENSDKDTIFPLDGVYRVHQGTRSVYDFTKSATKNLGLIITEGPHKDTQELQVPAFHWFNRHFKNEEGPIELLATPLFTAEQLKVFKELPADQINTKIQETFIPQAMPPSVPGSKEDWAKMRDAWMAALKEKTFNGWPKSAVAVEPKPAFSATREGLTLAAFDFLSQDHVPLRLYTLRREGLENAELMVLNVLDEASWPKWLAEMSAGFGEELKDLSSPGVDRSAFDSTRQMLQKQKWVMAYVAPRGVGPLANTTDEKKRTQILRRYALIGQTLAGMQVWDVRRAVQAIRALPTDKQTPLWLQADGRMAGVALYASLFEPEIARLDLHALPRTHVEGPHLLNVLKYLDLPAAVAMAAERSKVVLYQSDKGGWDYPQSVGQAMGWDAKRVQIRGEQ